MRLMKHLLNRLVRNTILFAIIFQRLKNLPRYTSITLPIPTITSFFCFQRWFVVDEFINSEGLDKFLHIDSDVLLYADFSKELEFIDFINNYDLTHPYASAHTSFFNNKSALCEFCNFIFEIFSDNSFFAQFENNPNDDKIYFKQGGFELELDKPLSDMTLVYFFTKLNRVRCLDTNKADFKNCCINGNFLSNSMLCSSFGNICYTVFDNCNIPYFIDTRDSVPKLLKMLKIPVFFNS